MTVKFIQLIKELQNNHRQSKHQLNVVRKENSLVSYFDFFLLVMEVGDVPIPLPNVKASILGPVCLIIEVLRESKRHFFLRFRLLSTVIIIKTIQNQNRSMTMTTTIPTKISTNQNGIFIDQILKFFYIQFSRSDDINEWDQNFVKRFTVAEGTLFDIIMVIPNTLNIMFIVFFFIFQAANYLGIKSLLAVGCKTIANMVRGKSSAEVREMFNISYDPPGEGLNAPNALEGQAGTVPTSPEGTTTGPSPTPDPMNQQNWIQDYYSANLIYFFLSFFFFRLFIFFMFIHKTEKSARQNFYIHTHIIYCFVYFVRWTVLFNIWFIG